MKTSPLSPLPADSALHWQRLLVASDAESARRGAIERRHGAHGATFVIRQLTHKFANIIVLAPDVLLRNSDAPLRSSDVRCERCSMHTADEGRGEGVRESSSAMMRTCDRRPVRAE